VEQTLKAKLVGRSGLIRILCIIIPPFLFALPFPPPPFNTLHTIRVDLSGDNPTSFNLTSFSASATGFGASLFSKVLGIHTEGMRTYVCFKDDSLVTPPDAHVDGSISVPLEYQENASLLVIPLGAQACKEFLGPAEFQLGNEVLWALDPGSNKFREVDFAIEGWEGYHWSWRTYLHDVLLLLFGWIIFCSSLIQISHWVRNGKPI
jgi:hypothetical protein